MTSWWKNCTMWVDGPPCCPDLWADCCQRHDEIQPWYRWPAMDVELARCIHAASYSQRLAGHPVQRFITRWIMPGLMWAGLQVGGYVIRPLNRIFGLGW